MNHETVMWYGDKERISCSYWKETPREQDPKKKKKKRQTKKGESVKVDS